MTLENLYEKSKQILNKLPYFDKAYSMFEPGEAERYFEKQPKDYRNCHKWKRKQEELFGKETSI